MSDGRRRADGSRPTASTMRKIALVGVTCVALAGAGAYAVAAHHQDLRLPLTQPSASATSGAATPAAPGARTVKAVPADVVFAEKAFNLWARPRMRSAAWWRALAPHLSAQGRLEIAGTDPAYLPDAVVTGHPSVVRRANGVFTQVRVPTRDGAFVVDVVRRDASAPWRVDRIGFPKVDG